MKVNKEYRQSFENKAKNIVDKMSLEEKVYLMSGKTSEYGERYNDIPFPAGGNQRLGVPEIKFADGPRGAVPGNSTCFPVSMGRGATFDKDLEYRVGKAIGKEIRAHGGNYFGGVCVNLPYNPGWGRSQEVYGEDSFLLGAFGSELVKGVQEENVIACVKHFAFNSMENARFKVNVTADKRAEREVYLSHFKDCIDAGAASVMTSYNLYQGEFCGQSDYLLNTVLKDEWGFDGFVITDFFWGIKGTEEAINGGMDVEMPDTKLYGDRLIEAVRDGRVSEDRVNEAALRIIRTMLAFNEAEDEKVYSKEMIGSKEHIELALEAAEKSLTLIQNEDNVLPFPKKVKSIAIIGKLGNKENTGDRGSSRVHPKYTVSPYEGISNYLPQAEVFYDDGKDLDKTIDLAKSVDAVIFVVGYDHDDEGEYVSKNFADKEITKEELARQGFALGGDRKSLKLHENEINLIKKIGPLNKNSVAVLIGGNMIITEEWKDDVSAILMAYYPGMEGGTALARLLFGDVNPSGKLPFVIVKRESDLPHVDWDAEEIHYDYYHGYAKLEKEGIKPSFPFGFGLSYTSFEITNPSFELKANNITASCVVKNKGDLSGDEVIQLYVGYSESSIDRPVKVLRGFERVSLKPEESKVVEISCPIEKVKWFNPNTNEWELEDIAYDIFIGNSSSSEDLLKGKITINYALK